MLPMVAYAQEAVRFKLTPSGSFSSETGEDFIVVPINDKSSHEIYQILETNIASVFNDPSKVMTGIEDSYIKIRGIIPVSQKEIKLLGQKTIAESKGYIQIEIRIKDGRIRISAPYIEDNIWVDGFSQEGSFVNIVSLWYKPEKKDQKRHENEQQVSELEFRVNTLINSILGVNHNQENIDDW